MRLELWTSTKLGTTRFPLIGTPSSAGPTNWATYRAPSSLPAVGRDRPLPPLAPACPSPGTSDWLGSR